MPIYYPTERAIEKIDKFGVATVRQGAMDFVGQIVDDPNEHDPSMKEAERVRMGGMAQSRYEESDLRKLWTPREKKDYRDFMRMYSRLITTYEPLQRKEIKEKMKARFNVTNPKAYEQRINNGLLDNPRLYIKTRNGRTIVNSVSEQKAYSTLRFAGELESVGK